MKLELAIPSRCTAKLPDDLSKEYLIAEEKLDGSRYVLYIGGDPYGRSTPNALLSRRVSTVDNKHVDRTQNLPHITAKTYAGLEGTILDGEVQATDFLETNSIMNSGPKLAVDKQFHIGPCTYHVFDVMFFRGKDVRGLALDQRRKILEAVVERMNNEHVKTIEQIKGDLTQYFNKIVAKGGEGIIVKDTRQGYGSGWAKMKKSYDVSVVVSGWHPGKPGTKYKNMVGSLLLSVYHEGKLLEVGRASGFDEVIRNNLTDNFEEYRGKVIDVFVQEIQDSKRSASNPVGRFRHATFHRFRDDVNAEDCTSEKLEADMKASKTKSKRSKDD